ncbi:MAG: radical SAM protein [Oscillospiraceae bacterium]|nr:radical SAM protein [Oscillospiraceae bacterium]
MTRYSIIHEKNPREILLLRGNGCRWRRCTFCDYHLDCSADEEANLALNRAEMAKVTGLYNHLEVINSGSFIELGETSLYELTDLCREKKIHTLHFECHWLYRDEISHWRKFFEKSGTTLKIKTGVESFDYNFREKVLRKGISERCPERIAESFDECCLLFGLTGQTEEGMRRDIETGLEYFERVCVNIFVENKTTLTPDSEVIDLFREKIMPQYIDNDRVDILISNTDFGVGGADNE